MKFIFLDVDGVLNTDRTLQRAADFNQRTWALDIKPTMLLAELVQKTKAKVVISSDWRLLENDPAALVLKMWLANFDIKVHSCTPDLTTGGDFRPRAEEICSWLIGNHSPSLPEAFVIIDDRRDAGEGLEDHFVRTDHEFGFVKKDLFRAMEIMNHEPSDATKKLIR